MVKIIQGDITELKVDAIVNTANSSLLTRKTPHSTRQKAAFRAVKGSEQQPKTQLSSTQKTAFACFFNAFLPTKWQHSLHTYAANSAKQLSVNALRLHSYKGHNCARQHIKSRRRPSGSFTETQNVSNLTETLTHAPLSQPADAQTPRQACGNKKAAACTCIRQPVMVKPVLP